MRTPKSGSRNGALPAESKKKKKQKSVMGTSYIEEDDSDDSSSEERRSLSEVVSELSVKWFEETLKEAKSGDVAMQVLVAQMYYHGYGTLKDLHRANHWITKASRVRSSAWNVSSKRPGYHASDSDSESEDNS